MIFDAYTNWLDPDEALNSEVSARLRAQLGLFFKMNKCFYMWSNSSTDLNPFKANIKKSFMCNKLHDLAWFKVCEYETAWASTSGKYYFHIVHPYSPIFLVSSLEKFSFFQDVEGSRTLTVYYVRVVEFIQKCIANACVYNWLVEPDNNGYREVTNL